MARSVIKIYNVLLTGDNKILEDDRDKTKEKFLVGNYSTRQTIVS